MVSQEDIRRNLEERIRLGKPIDWDLEVKQQKEYQNHLKKLAEENPRNEVEIDKIDKILIKLDTGKLIESMEKRIKVERPGGKVTSRIFLENSHSLIGNGNLPDEAISIIELEDRVEVLRFNLEDRPSPYLDNPDILRSEKFKHSIVYAGIMPKKKYFDLFNFLEQKNVWELGFCSVGYFGVGKNNLFISKNQKKHALTGEGIYYLPKLDKTGINTWHVPRDIPQEWRYNAIKLLKISKKICEVSKKYAKTKITNNQNPRNPQ